MQIVNYNINKIKHHKMYSFLIGILGGPEIIVIIAVVLLLFGGKKIPELMRGLGKGMREFKNVTKDIKDEIDDIDPKNSLK